MISFLSFSQVNYLSSMEVAMTLLNPLLVAVYFLVYLVISLAVSNIALSIIIDLHANVRSFIIYFM